jgi:hypothetical protein
MAESLATKSQLLIYQWMDPNSLITIRYKYDFASINNIKVIEFSREYKLKGKAH